VHGILPGERDAIIWLHEQWGSIDKSHRRLAHRGSRLDLVHVSESTVSRVLRAENLLLPGRSPPEPHVRAPWPDWVAWKPNTIWCYDFTHFSRARRVALALLDIVSRKWLACLVSAEQTSTQIQVCFTPRRRRAGHPPRHRPAGSAPQWPGQRRRPRRRAAAGAAGDER
jgi:putative transposase